MRIARLRTAHPMLWAAAAALAIGAVLCVIGWYGVSGERFVERQVPYLASSTLPGVALIVSGAVLLAHGRGALAAARVEELYELLVATPVAESGESTAVAAPVATSRELLLIPGGTLWHRADCPLVAGKPEAVPADAHARESGDLAPCPICEPDKEPREPGQGGAPMEPGAGAGPMEPESGAGPMEPGSGLGKAPTAPRPGAEPREPEPGPGKAPMAPGSGREPMEPESNRAPMEPEPGPGKPPMEPRPGTQPMAPESDRAPTAPEPEPSKPPMAPEPGTEPMAPGSGDAPMKPPPAQHGDLPETDDPAPEA